MHAAALQLTMVLEEITWDHGLLRSDVNALLVAEVLQEVVLRVIVEWVSAVYGALMRTHDIYYRNGLHALLANAQARNEYARS